MSNPMRNQDSTRLHHVRTPQQTAARIDAELAHGYVETEPEGLTLQELLCVYRALLREGRDRVFDNVRSLFRLHPAH